MALLVHISRSLLISPPQLPTLTAAKALVLSMPNAPTVPPDLRNFKHAQFKDNFDLASFLPSPRPPTTPAERTILEAAVIVVHEIGVPMQRASAVSAFYSRIDTELLDASDSRSEAEKKQSLDDLLSSASYLLAQRYTARAPTARKGTECGASPDAGINIDWAAVQADMPSRIHRLG